MFEKFIEVSEKTVYVEEVSTKKELLEILSPEALNYLEIKGIVRITFGLEAEKIYYLNF